MLWLTTVVLELVAPRRSHARAQGQRTEVNAQRPTPETARGADRHHMAIKFHCRKGPRRLFRPLASLHRSQCRVPPSPPAIRDMKKPRLRKLAGASDSGGA